MQIELKKHAEFPWEVCCFVELSYGRVFRGAATDEIGRARQSSAR